MGDWGYALGLQVADLLLNLTPPPPPGMAHWLAMKVSDGNLPKESLGVPDGPAQIIEREQSVAWLALYTVAAAGRFAEVAKAKAEDGGTYAMAEAYAAMSRATVKEERYFDLALQAEERRMRAAALQDMAHLLNVDRTLSTKGLLGWRAILDNRTTPECRWAHGRNFKADRMPSIGWPGAVHIGCRCSPGPAVPGAAVIPSV